MKEKTVEELQAEIEALQQKNTQLNAQVAVYQTEGIASQMAGVTPEIAEDVKRRVALGLPIHHAVQAAQSQAQNDKRVLAEEKANALKLAQGVELAKAKMELANLEAQHELERTNARIAELKAKPANK